jgi:hypothetical protein
MSSINALDFHGNIKLASRPMIMRIKPINTNFRRGQMIVLKADSMVTLDVDVVASFDMLYSFIEIKDKAGGLFAFAKAITYNNSSHHKMDR